jgi:esterase/lipase
MKIVSYGESHAYLFEQNTSDTLIINIDGSAWYSILGIKNEKRWTNVGNGAQLLKALGKEYTFLIPEKFKRQPGMLYFYDIEERAMYTANNLIDCYVESINGYLSEHSFKSIILVGTSEGAMVLPLIYEKLNDKNSVKAIVSIGFGGLSLYDSYVILSKRPNLPPMWIGMYQYFVEVFKPGLEIYPDSYDKDIFGTTYRWFNSFKNIRPFDYYKNIDIPILFIHGKKDYNLPVESTQYIQENLPEKPFEYLYYNWAHMPGNYFDIIGLRKDITQWIRRIDS